MAQHANWNRRHFEETAEVIYALPVHFSVEQHEMIACAFADKFERTNPGFDRRLFLAQCGVDPDERA